MLQKQLFDRFEEIRWKKAIRKAVRLAGRWDMLDWAKGKDVGIRETMTQKAFVVKRLTARRGIARRDFDAGIVRKPVGRLCVIVEG